MKSEYFSMDTSNHLMYHLRRIAVLSTLLINASSGSQTATEDLMGGVQVDEVDSDPLNNEMNEGDG